ncbi:MAG: hypothetical protein HY982_00365, partial [Candidatus Magasanikbacteria bacterium]|nr:hypothetical protein [Candidatus Magasanikbacteria bacterium]
MLDIKFIRDNKKLVEKNNKTRKVSVDLEKLLSLDSQRREMQMETDGLANERNKISKSKPTEAEIVEMR